MQASSNYAQDIVQDTVNEASVYTATQTGAQYSAVD